MFLNFSKMLYLMVILFSIVITLSSSNWMICWLMMEINMMMFVPFISSTEYFMDSPQSMKYFLVQAFGSVILMFFITTFLSSSYNPMMFNTKVMVPIALAVKSGTPPFHFWFPQIMEMSSLIQCLMMSTLQKIIPLFLLAFSSSQFLMIMICLSAVVGSIGGFNQNSMKKILAYSSMSHTAWLLTSIMNSFSSFLSYIMMYYLVTTILIYFLYVKGLNLVSDSVNNHKDTSKIDFNIVFALMSLGGLPPLLGFLAKMVVINEATSSLVICFILILSSLISLIYYLKITHLAFIGKNSSKKTKLDFQLDKFSIWLLFLSLMNISTNSILPLLILSF